MPPKRSLPSSERHPRNRIKRARTIARKVSSKPFDHMGQVASQPFVRSGVFRFLDLPAELRRKVYHYSLPHDLQIHFIPHSPDTPYEETKWEIWGIDKPAGPTNVAFRFARLNDGSLGYAIDKVTRLRSREPQTQLFVLNKLSSSEAKAVLYGENTFVFRVDGNSHRPKSLESPRIFGPLGHPRCLYLLRNIRKVEVVMEIPISGIATHWTAKRHRARLDYFIRILKEHADDEDQRSLLERLTVHADWGRSQNVMYNLESLTSLRGIQDVDIKGNYLPTWYSKCLQLCVQGKGGNLLSIDYPLLLKRKLKKSNLPRRQKTYIKVWETTKLWHDPVFNWEEFADRNGISRPELNPIDLTGDLDDAS